jgi:hypothetical protein
MVNIEYLTGRYNKSGNVLIHSQYPIKLLITSRINVTTKKSVKFLLDKTEKSGTYISSLYPISDHTGIETYKFDYKGFKYILQQPEQGIIIIENVKVTE